jgi:hypothetical protein
VYFPLEPGPLYQMCKWAVAQGSLILDTYRASVGAMCLNVPQKIRNILTMHIHPPIHAMALQPKSGLGLHYLLSPQCSIISGQLPIATTQKSGSILLRHIFQSFLGFLTDLTPSNLALSTFLGIRVPSIRCTCLAH